MMSIVGISSEYDIYKRLGVKRPELTRSEFLELVEKQKKKAEKQKKVESVKKQESQKVKPVESVKKPKPINKKPVALVNKGASVSNVINVVKQVPPSWDVQKKVEEAVKSGTLTTTPSKETQQQQAQQQKTKKVAGVLRTQDEIMKKEKQGVSLASGIKEIITKTSLGKKVVGEVEEVVSKAKRKTGELVVKNPSQAGFITSVLNFVPVMNKEEVVVEGEKVSAPQLSGLGDVLLETVTSKPASQIIKSSTEFKQGQALGSITTLGSSLAVSKIKNLQTPKIVTKVEVGRSLVVDNKGFSEIITPAKVTLTSPSGLVEKEFGVSGRFIAKNLKSGARGLNRYAAVGEVSVETGKGLVSEPAVSLGVSKKVRKGLVTSVSIEQVKKRDLGVSFSINRDVMKTITPSEEIISGRGVVINQVGEENPFKFFEFEKVSSKEVTKKLGGTNTKTKTTKYGVSRSGSLVGETNKALVEKGVEILKKTTLSERTSFSPISPPLLKGKGVSALGQLPEISYSSPTPMTPPKPSALTQIPKTNVDMSRSVKKSKPKTKTPSSIVNKLVGESIITPRIKSKPVLKTRTIEDQLFKPMKKPGYKFTPPRLDLKPRTRQKLRISQKPRIITPLPPLIPPPPLKTITKTKPPIPTITPLSIIPPSVPPIIPPTKTILPPSIPPLFGLGKKRSKTKKKRGKAKTLNRVFNYVPSVSSFIFGIKGRTPKTPLGGFTGLEQRPLPIRKNLTRIK